MSVLKMRWEACLASVEVIFNRQVLYYAAIYMLFSLCIYTYWTFCKQFQLSQNTWVKMQNKHTWGNYTMRGLGVLVFVGVFLGCFFVSFFAGSSTNPKLAGTTKMADLFKSLWNLTISHWLLCKTQTANCPQLCQWDKRLKYKEYTSSR